MMKIKKVNCLFILVLLIFHFKGPAQFTRFKRITNEEGLQSISINAIAQDKNGFIWLGSTGGISKYDGYKLINYTNVSDTSGISSSNVSCLLADKNDKLWIGFYKGGMNCLDLRTNEFTYYKYDSLNANSILSETVKSIVELNDDELALATSKGLDIFNRKTNSFKHYRHSENDPKSLMSDNIKSIVKDKDGSLWIAHYGKGISHLNLITGEKTEYTVGNDNKHLSYAGIKDLMLDRDGLLWISLWNAGINILDTKTGSILHPGDTAALIRNASKIGLVFDIYEDKSGKIWFATAESGIIRFDKKTGENLIFKNDPDDPESLGDNTVMSLLEDRTGVLWAGTWRNGVNYFDTRSLLFGYFKHESNNEGSLNNNIVSKIFYESEEKILLGTASSITEFNPKTKKFKTFPVDKRGESLGENSIINDIALDRTGLYWIATNGGGLYRFDPIQNKYKRYFPTNDSNSIGGDTPLKIVVDDNNDLWLSLSFYGLYHFDRKKDKFYKVNHLTAEERKSGQAKITQLLKDEEGNILIATEAQGLLRLNVNTRSIQKIYSPIDPKTKLGLVISAMAFDKNGMLLLATSDGLIRLNRKTGQTENFTLKNPLLKILIIGIIEDDENNLWLSGTDELLRFDPVKNTVTEFHPADGLQGREFFPHSYCKMKDGHLLFGGIKGFNYFLPAELANQKEPPALHFTELTVENKNFDLPQHIAYTNSITLSYKNNFFSLSFAALDFANPEEHLFKYKLEGFNEDWVDIKDQHSITFTNLDHGSYLLKIKGCNSNGIWNETPLTLQITITPPFWKTKWFYALCVIIIISSFYGYIKYREKKHVKEKVILEKKVAERTEELNIEKLKVEEAHKDIKDSIHYAQRIQKAILTPLEILHEVYPDSFILYQPKDIVSGDFYWILHSTQKLKRKDRLAFAAADCTGHGVPGAFMSMLNSSLLNQTAHDPNINTPAEALNFLNAELPKNLKSSEKGQSIKDGMDIAFCLVDLTTNILHFAGANNPCWIIRKFELIELAPTKQAITASDEYEKKRFTDQEFQLQKGDCIYVFTDGYADQFGGPKGKKFKYKTLANLLIQINTESMERQREILRTKFMEWKGDLEQVDDVCIIGVRV